MKKIIPIILSIIILFLVGLFIIEREVGKEVEITKIDTSFGIKLTLNKKPFYNEKNLLFIIQKNNTQFKMVCDYFLEQNRPVIKFMPTYHLFEFLDLHWEASTEQILTKLDNAQIIIKNINY